MAVKKPSIPKSPSPLTAEEQKVWDSVYNAINHDFIPNECLPLLVLYCRHVCKERHIAAQIEKIESRLDLTDLDHLKIYKSLMTLLDNEGRSVAAHARSLRLTSQALRSVNDSNRSADHSPKPWEVE
ncbi:hypothetical protein [Ketogulonicigenium vulgare]|uniref:hypothetical protein n=1 Tax=Ketogulonicigenium vulgare TaxID=92945 RepID=UPI00235925E3|nr:hypothetical protein [Ketogulonicigenium vulgare]